jgi:hypothetical protein
LEKPDDDDDIDGEPEEIVAMLDVFECMEVPAPL